MPAPRFVGGKADKADHFRKTGRPLRRGVAAAVENRTPERAREFCERFAEVANVRQACRELKFSITFIYDWIEDDPTFAEQVERARRAAVGVLEEAAKIRAVDGILKPIYQGGVLVGHVREYSDQLMVTLLKSHDPKRYRENLSVEHGGKLDLGSMTDEQIAERQAAVTAALGAGTVAAPAGVPRLGRGARRKEG